MKLYLTNSWNKNKAFNNLSHSGAILVIETMEEIDESKAGANIRWYWSRGPSFCEWLIAEPLEELSNINSCRHLEYTSKQKKETAITKRCGINKILAQPEATKWHGWIPVLFRKLLVPRNIVSNVRCIDGGSLYVDGC